MSLIIISQPLDPAHNLCKPVTKTNISNGVMMHAMPTDPTAQFF